MSVLDRLRASAERAAQYVQNTANTATKRVVHLPLVSDSIVESFTVERALAERGVVPKRCGLCSHFSRAEFEETLRLNPPFAEACRQLTPTQMGGPRRGDGVSPAARALRPKLQERWDDYGACTLHRIHLWGFAEQPQPSDDAPPCDAWET